MLHLSQKPKPLTTTSSWTALTWNNFHSKRKTNGLLWRQLRVPHHVFFSIYGGAFRGEITHNEDLLKRTCLCFYVGEITPPRELSCACLQLAHFLICLSLWCMLPCSFFSTGGPLAISLFYYSYCQIVLGSEEQWQIVKYVRGGGYLTILCTVFKVSTDTYNHYKVC